jgi:hypothetical protein
MGAPMAELKLHGWPWEVASRGREGEEWRGEGEVQLAGLEGWN